MGAVAHLSESAVEVEPGRTATVTITVRNTGTVVDRFGFEALGVAAPWLTFAPTSLSLFPDASGTVTVTFGPRRDPSVAAGPTPFAVRVTSAEDPSGSVVEEGTVTVGAFSDINVELLPRVTAGRLVGRARLAVDNRSNCGYRAELLGKDQKDALAFAFRPAVVDVAPGQAAFVKVAMRPRSRFWRGMARTHPIQVLLRNDWLDLLATSEDFAGSPGSASGPRAGAGPAGAATSPVGATPPAGTPAGAGPAAGAAPTSSAPTSGPPGRGPATTPAPPASPSAAASARGGIPGAAAPRGTGSSAGLAPADRRNPHKSELTTEGTMLQEPLLPRWLLTALAALVALGLLLLLLWFSLVKPQIHSTAQSEVGHQLAANGITSSSTPSSPKGSGSGQSGSGGGSSGGSGGGSSSVTTPATGSGSSGSAGVTVNGSLLASGNGTRSITVPKGRTLEITDLLVQNSAGNNGNLALERNGTILMQWAMANFRDIDYHWITPTVFSPGAQVQLVVSGCTSACNPGVYYAGRLVP